VEYLGCPWVSWEVEFHSEVSLTGFLIGSLLQLAVSQTAPSLFQALTHADYLSIINDARKKYASWAISCKFWEARCSLNILLLSTVEEIAYRRNFSWL
jgi:hypothetical protein